MSNKSDRCRVAYVFQAGVRFSESSAAPLHIYYILRGLQEARHQATLVALQPGRKVLCTEDLEAIKCDNLLGNHFSKPTLSSTAFYNLFESGVRRVQSELGLPYFALFDSHRMYEACRENLRGYDLIHERHNLLALGGAFASRRLGIPYVLEFNADPIQECAFQGTPEHGLRKLWAVWAIRFCFDIAKKIICVSSQLKDHLINNWRLDERKITVLPNAADTEAFERTYDSEALKKRLGLTTEPIIMFVGGFYAWHDLHLLLDSFTRVLQTFPDAKLILIGDGRTRPAVDHKIADDELQHAVIMPGTMDHSKIPEMLTIADVAVAPYPRIGTGFWFSPLKLFEYMAAGKAIVATRTGQITEVIQSGHTGLLIEPGDVDGFADAIVTLLSDSVERERLGQNARRQAVEQHSWKHYVKRLEKIYAGILDNRE